MKADPLSGASHAKGIVLMKMYVVLGVVWRGRGGTQMLVGARALSAAVVVK